MANKILFCIPEETRQRLDRLCYSDGSSLSENIRAGLTGVIAAKEGQMSGQAITGVVISVRSGKLEIRGC